jgi:hypothetical protein
VSRHIVYLNLKSEVNILSLNVSSSWIEVIFTAYSVIFTDYRILLDIILEALA